jgi:hypothetical protein
MTCQNPEDYGFLSIKPLILNFGLLAETINGLYKTELIWKHGPWIGNVPPAEFEKTYYDRLEALPLVAGHT